MPRAVPAIAATVLLWTASAPALAGGQTREREPRTIVVEVRDRGFRWADAAIGALATLGLIVAGAGATLVIRRGRS
jgi:hypothetical protein